MESSENTPSFTFRVLQKLVDNRLNAELMTQNRIHLTGVKPEVFEKIVKELKEEDYIEGFNPRFLSLKDLEKFHKKVLEGNVDGAIVYVQNHSGMIGQETLNEVIQKVEDELTNS